LAKVFYVRLGHANNSSSDHHIILNNKGPALVRTKLEKLSYLSATLYLSLESIIGPELAMVIARAWTNGAKPDFNIKYDNRLIIPRSLERWPANKEFYKELSDFILRKDVAIIASDMVGNYLLDAIPRGRDEDYVARKDHVYNYWTLFNYKTGYKVRLSLESGEAVTPTRSSVPDLIDVKITDFCRQGCSFCYQNSKSDGGDADPNAIWTLAEEAASNGVFEMVLGGGEPTQHREFSTLIDGLFDIPINISFTTRRHDWFDTIDMQRLVSFAYSYNDYEDLQELVRKLGQRNISRVNVQFLLGTLLIEDLTQALKFLAANNIDFTLLGFQQIGRGQTYIASPYSDAGAILEIIMSLQGNNSGSSKFGINETLAKQWKDALKSSGVGDVFYDTGRFSMYFDAVSSAYAEDSFSRSLFTYNRPDEGFEWYANS
jgi:organic radical activating enzyme